MRIAVIGTGTLGAALGKVWSAAGHAIMYGSRKSRQREGERARGRGHRGRRAVVGDRGGTASGFICGDDAEGKAEVAALADVVGFDVVDCGPLKNARALEPLAMLWGQLAFPLGLGPDIAFRLLQR